MQDSIWTEERIDALICLWLRGKSASEIASWFAERKVSISRNAVIGKVFRLRKKGALKAGHRKGSRPVADAPEKPPETPPRHDLAQVNTLLPRSKPEPPKPAATKSQPIPPANPFIIKPSDGRERRARVPLGLPDTQCQPDEPAATKGPATLLTLRFGQCRYPITSEPPYHFCEAHQEEGSSYCKEHHKLTHTGHATRVSLWAA